MGGGGGVWDLKKKKKRLQLRGVGECDFSKEYVIFALISSLTLYVGNRPI